MEVRRLDQSGQEDEVAYLQEHCSSNVNMAGLAPYLGTAAKLVFDQVTVGSIVTVSNWGSSP